MWLPVMVGRMTGLTPMSRANVEEALPAESPDQNTPSGTSSMLADATNLNLERGKHDEMRQLFPAPGAAQPDRRSPGMPRS